MPVSNKLAGRAQAVFAFALATTAVQASAQAADAQAVLQTARDEVVAAGAALRRFNVETKKACDDADAADDQLLKEGRSPSPLTQSLAKAALLKRELCGQWKSSKEEAQSQSDAARSALRQVAAEPVRPASAATNPITAPSVTRADPSPAQLRNIITDAQSAQETVEIERKAVQGLYDRVDSATKAALALKQSTDLDLVALSNTLQSSAKEARTAASAAQKAANRFLEHALTIKGCLLGGAANCALQYRVSYSLAVEAQEEMEVELALAKQRREDLDEAAAKVEVAGKWEDAASRARALRFAKLLQKYPDSGAAFAKNSFTVLASGKENSATVKLDWDRLYAGGWSDVTLLFSAPLADKGQSRVFSYADGQTGVPKVGLSYVVVDARPLKGTDTGLFSLSTGLRFGTQTRSYYEDGPTFPKAASSVRVSPWSLSVAAVGHDPSTRNAHLIRASWQRAFKDGPSKNRCPVDRNGDMQFVDCITGTFGAPKGRNEGVLSYQFRYQSEDFAVSPTLTHNTWSRVTELGMPLYLVRSADDDKRPFNAGIRADWTSKGKESISGNTQNQWSFGVFFGADFSLFSRADTLPE